MIELLEQEEKKVRDREAAAKKAAADHGSSKGESRDPRRQGRDARDKYSAEREENNERRARKSRDLASDEEMKGGSDRASANGSHPSRRRSRSPRRASSRDRADRAFRDDRADHYRGSRPPSRSDDDRYYRPSGRSRRIDNEELPAGHSARRGADRGDRRDDRRTDRDIDRYTSGREIRDRRRYSSPLPREAKTPEPTDDERDKRTVFVQQLAARLRNSELRTFFAQVGPVVDAQIVKDRVSGRSKG